MVPFPGLRGWYSVPSAWPIRPWPHGPFDATAAPAWDESLMAPPLAPRETAALDQVLGRDPDGRRPLGWTTSARGTRRVDDGTGGAHSPDGPEGFLLGR